LTILSGQVYYSHYAEILGNDDVRLYDARKGARDFALIEWIIVSLCKAPGRERFCFRRKKNMNVDNFREALMYYLSDLRTRFGKNPEKLKIKEQEVIIWLRKIFAQS